MTMPTARDAVRLLVLALALGLSVLALVALACGPAASSMSSSDLVATPESQPAAPPGTGCAVTDLGTLSGTVSRSGRWASDCPSMQLVGNYARFYSFTLSQESQVTIDLVSNNQDTYLFLLSGAGTGGSALQRDNDGGAGTNARIVRTLAAGSYTVEATPRGSGATGSFTLTIRGGVGAAAPATATATPTPADTPLSTAQQGAATVLPPARMGGIVSAWADYQATRESRSPGTADRTAPEKTIAIQIRVWPPAQRDGITGFLESHGIAHSPVVGNYDIYATVPVSLLSRLTALPGVRRIWAKPNPYPNLNWGLNILIAKYEAGLMPDEDANPTFAWLVIYIDGDDNYDAVRAFLENNGAIMVYADSDIAQVYKPDGSLSAFVPVAAMLPLAGLAGVEFAYSMSYPVPERFRITMAPILPTEEPDGTPTPTATPTAGTRDVPSGRSVGIPPTPAPAPAGAIAHNADNWHAAGIKGQGIKNDQLPDANRVHCKCRKRAVSVIGVKEPALLTKIARTMTTTTVQWCQSGVRCGAGWFKSGLTYWSVSDGYELVPFSGSDDCMDLNGIFYPQTERD